MNVITVTIIMSINTRCFSDGKVNGCSSDRDFKAVVSLIINVVIIVTSVNKVAMIVNGSNAINHYD